MLTHSFDRFYVVTKFEIPKIDDLKLTTFTFDFARWHLMFDRTFMQKYLKHCQRIVPYIRLYQKLLCNKIMHGVLLIMTFVVFSYLYSTLFLIYIFGTVMSRGFGCASLVLQH